VTASPATLTSAAAARALRLPPPLTRSVTACRGLAVRARDGAILRTDHYAPRLDDAPTVLVRTPYGRGGLNALAARMFAERGFHVVVSSCRGTGGSSGAFDPMRHERADGLDTVDWLRRQQWFNGRLGTFGPSYVGYTQWAIADVPEIAAMATAVTASQFRDPTYSGGSFALFTTLAWASLLHSQASPRLADRLELLRGQPRLRRAFAHLPLGEADRMATGVEVAFFRRWLSLSGAPPSDVDAYWGEMNHDNLLPKVTAPVLMVGGWQDIFLPWQLRDYAALLDAGARPHLTIGPWTHGSGGLLIESLRESIEWLRAHLRGEPGALRTRPVRLYVGGADQWREYDEWPPGAAGTQRAWHLHPGGRLSTQDPRPSTPDSFVYDPNDPTPSVAGPVLVANLARPRDNAELEARSDVLVYTGQQLIEDLEVVGPVSATIHVKGSRPYFDVFVRLCDVTPAGVSVNVCDGLRRVSTGVSTVYSGSAGSGPVPVEVEMWPAAHRFRAGHRIRVQVSAGAHPRYPRNPGTGDPLATAVTLQPVRIEVWHDPDRPSYIRLVSP
jgi:putative CocE/NonD family hydrolase